MKFFITFTILFLSLSAGCGEKNYKKMLKQAGTHRKKAIELEKKGAKWYKKSFTDYKKAYEMDMSVFKQQDYYALGNMYGNIDKNKREQEFMYKQGKSAPIH